MATMTETLRAALLASGKPLAHIAEATGVQRASLSRFVRGERSLRLDFADVLADYFALELKPRTSKAK